MMPLASGVNATSTWRKCYRQLYKVKPSFQAEATVGVSKQI